MKTTGRGMHTQTLQREESPGAQPACPPSHGWFRSPLRFYLTAAGVLALAAYLLVFATGMTMVIDYTLYQLLDVDLLRDRLAESLLYLHAQPPVLNLLLGLALKLERATGLAPETSLRALHLGLAAATLAGLACLLAELLPRRRALGVLVIVLVVFHPVIWIQIHTFFYVVEETALLTGLVLAWTRWLSRRRPFDHAMLCLCVLLLCYTRSLFHIVWAIPLLLIGPVLVRRAASWRRHAIISAVAMVLLLAWPAKNLMLMCSFGFSSWVWGNLARGIEETGMSALIPDINGLYRFEDWAGESVRWTDYCAEVGYQPERAPLHVKYWVGHEELAAAGGRQVRVRMRLGDGAWTEAIHNSQGIYEMRLEAPYRAGKPVALAIEVDPSWVGPCRRRLGIGFFLPNWEMGEGQVAAEQVELAHVTRGMPERLRSVPALTAVRKRHSTRDIGNANHYSFLANNELLKPIVLRALRQQPQLFWHKVKRFYLCTTLFSGVNPYFGHLLVDDQEAPLLAAWMRFYRETVNQEYFDPRLLAGDEPLQLYRQPSALMLLFPLMVLGPLVAAFVRRRREPRQVAIALVMLYPVLWVVLMVLLIDGYEGNRMRLPIMPMLLLLSAWALPKQTLLCALWNRILRRRTGTSSIAAADRERIP